MTATSHRRRKTKWSFIKRHITSVMVLLLFVLLFYRSSIYQMPGLTAKRYMTVEITIHTLSVYLIVILCSDLVNHRYYKIERKYNNKQQINTHKIINYWIITVIMATASAFVIYHLSNLI